MRRFVAVLSFVIAAFLCELEYALSQTWFNAAWQYRRPVTITTNRAITDYQVPVVLPSSFEFSSVQSGGRDLRVTASDGVTLLPFWIEKWDPTNRLSRIWARVPNLSSGKNTIYLYYGNASASASSNGRTAFEFFEDWPTTTSSGNPIFTIQGGGAWEQNSVSYPMVFKEGSVYYLLYDGHNPNQKGLARSSDLITWTRDAHNPVVRCSGVTGSWDQSGVAWGSLVKVGPTYYLLVAGEAPTRWSIGVETSTDLINWNRTPVGASNPILTARTQAWETSDSISGPSVLKRLDGITPVVHNGMYWMAYHGYNGAMKIGLASSTNLLQWTKYGGNPVLAPVPERPWESDGLWVTDMVAENGIYYILYYGRKIAPDGRWQFHISYAYSDSATEFPGTWHRSADPNPLLEYGAPGSWEDKDHEDPILRKYNNTYYLFYTASGAQQANGFATASRIGGPYTKFTGTAFSQWAVEGTPVMNGQTVTLLGPAPPGSAIQSLAAYAPGRALGFTANFRISTNNWKWGGFIDGLTESYAYIGTVGIPGTTNLVLTSSATPGASRSLASIGPVSNAIRVYELAWQTTAIKAFVDHSASAAASLNAGIPAGPLPIQFRDFNDAAAPITVSWAYLRKYSEPEPTLTVQPRQRRSSGFGPFAFVVEHDDQTPLDATIVEAPNSPALGTGIPAPAFRLEDCYPNPSNPSTTISFSLPTESYVRLEVFSPLGQRVSRIVDDVRAAGNHSIILDASSYASGVYFYRLTAAGFVATKKFTVLK